VPPIVSITTSTPRLSVAAITASICESRVISTSTLAPNSRSRCSLAAEREVAMMALAPSSDAT
jgi:hypothetical protein